MFKPNRLSDSFKGIINKINNSSNSPTKEGNGSATSSGEVPIEDSDEEQLIVAEAEREGFLCPLCLIGFPSADDLQSHYSVNHANQLDSEQSILCSVCKMRFGSQSECEAHFMRHHNSKDSESECSETPQQSIIVDNSELKEELKRIESLLGVGGEVELLRGQVKAMQESKELMLQEIVSLRKDLEIEHSKKDDLQGKSAAQQATWAEEKRKLLEENNRLSKEKFQQMSSQSDEAAQAYISEIARLDEVNKGLVEKSGDLTNKLAYSQRKLEESEDKRNELKQRLDHSEAVLEKTENDNEREIKDLEEKFKDQLDTLSHEFSAKEMKWEKQLQMSAESEATIENERRSLEHIVGILRDESNAKDALRQQMEGKFKEEKAATAKAFEDKIRDTGKSGEEKMALLQKQFDEKKREVEIYENEKVTLEKQMEVINSELRKVKEGLEQKIIESTKQAATLKELEVKLGDIRKDFKKKENAYDQEITSLKQEVLLYEDKAEKEKTVASALLVEKLELEVQLSLATDELRQRNEATSSKEKELDRLRVEVLDNRRKYDDTLAALLDIGRENQSLQIEQAKLMGRKWADDSQVVECQACSKAFTLTVRKHHCRNCGQIFCNECSTKQATFANYKNKVRVCDPCFLEINQGNAE